MRHNKIICCPICHSELIISESIYTCSNISCNATYRKISNIPVFVPNENILFNHSKLILDSSPFFKKNKFFNFFKKFVPNISHNIKARENFLYIENFVRGQNSKVLIIGSGSGGIGSELLDKVGLIDLVKTDVCVHEDIDYICDAHNLPFIDKSFDVVVIQAVLEHVINPKNVVKEIHRVLKTNGLVYSETPFMQQVHGAEYDFTRYTRSGHRSLFSYFTEIKSGQTGGVGMSLAWSIEYFILGIIKWNIIKYPFAVLVRYFTFTLKYFDYIALRFNYNRSCDGASGFYFLGMKSDNRLTNKELIEYYM